MKKTIFKRVATILITGVSGIVLLSGSPAGALTQNQLNVLNQGIYFYNTEVNDCSAGAASASSALVGADNIEKAYNFFVGKGLSPIQAAGIVGNFWWESHGVNPAIEQTPGAWNDTTTKPSPPYPDYGHAVGIAQWDGPRRIKIINNAKDSSKDVKDLAFQLDYSWSELNGDYTNVLKSLRATLDPTSATMVFGRGYESPDEKQANWPQRIDDANTILTQYGNGSSAPGGTACGVTCDTSGNATSGNLSSIRRQAVCIAQGELKTVWTPLPATPRLQYTKYTDGWICNSGQAPDGAVCGDGNELWCADFASWVYKQAGYPFSGGVSGGWRLPAVQQIQDLGKADQQFHWHPAADYTPVPGDLAIHGYGHVNIVVNVSGNQIQLIGGDQGSGPYGGPESASVVSKVTMNSPTDDSTIGYVSPD